MSQLASAPDQFRESAFQSLVQANVAAGHDERALRAGAGIGEFEFNVGAAALSFIDPLAGTTRDWTSSPKPDSPGQPWTRSRIPPPDNASHWGPCSPTDESQAWGRAAFFKDPVFSDVRVVGGAADDAAANAAQADMLAEDMAELDSHETSFYSAPHGNSLQSLAEAQGYILEDAVTGEPLKYGMTTLGQARYSLAQLQCHECELEFCQRGQRCGDASVGNQTDSRLSRVDR